MISNENIYNVYRFDAPPLKFDEVRGWHATKIINYQSSRFTATKFRQIVTPTQPHLFLCGYQFHFSSDLNQIYVLPFLLWTHRSTILTNIHCTKGKKKEKRRQRKRDRGKETEEKRQRKRCRQKKRDRGKETEEKRQRISDRGKKTEEKRPEIPWCIAELPKSVLTLLHSRSTFKRELIRHKIHTSKYGWQVFDDCLLLLGSCKNELFSLFSITPIEIISKFLEIRQGVVVGNRVPKSKILNKALIKTTN